MPHVYVIAEAGVNHDGDIEKAFALIDAAAEAGADAVKFQTFKAEELVSPTAPKARYQSEQDGAGGQFEMLKRLELSPEAYPELGKRCKERGIQFLSTPFDAQNLDMLLEIGMPCVKIPSGELTNLPFLRHVAKAGKPVVMSTGMASLEEVRQAVTVLIKAGLREDAISLLHCNTQYPTPIEDANLKAISTLLAAFPGSKVGYSDHTLGIEAPIAAVALGAEVVEKHFTLDKSLPGPDHAASLEPDELRAMIAAIRQVEKALGSGIKEPSQSERDNIIIARRYLVAKKDIRAGELFSAENLTAKRLGREGLSPMLWDEIVGTPAKRDYKKNEGLDS